jgi:hypothetical protein
MRILSASIPVITISLGLCSCADFFGGNTHDHYRRGVADGRAQVIRQRYWKEQNKPLQALPVLEKRYTPIYVPERTTEDGLIIEAHQEIVETVH